ncbi:Ig-like domain-containing protein, partial [Pseudactinotalea sp.]|uniref:Ig-like domain-containing protein n=1 Tax=Pseudactinotalea sp. TaxID=1926260 RepID=UPI003B3AF795
MAALVAVGAFVLSPPAVPQAAAAEVGDAVTDVHITESSVPDGRAQLRLNIAFEVGANAAAGDTFWVQLDPTLLTRAFSYNIYAEGSSTQIVARMTTTLGGRVTFTLTDYVDDRSATE